MIIEENTEYYAVSTSKDRSVTGVVAMLEDYITETGCVPRTLHLDGAKEFVRDQDSTRGRENEGVRRGKRAREGVVESETERGLSTRISPSASINGVRVFTSICRDSQ